MSDPDRLVILQDGYVAPVEALRLAWRLEDEGFRFRLDQDGCLMLSPWDKLTTADLTSVRRWARHLESMLAHFEAHDLAAHLVATPQARPVPLRRTA